VSTPQVVEVFEWPPEEEDVLAPRRLRHALTHNPSMTVGACLVLFIVLLAVIGPFAWTIDPNSQDYERLMAPSGSNPMGTDELGRDTFARVIHGAQVSLEIGLGAVVISLVLGLVVGLASAYYGRWADAVLMRSVDIMFAFPALVFAIMMAATLGPSRTNEMITIGIIFSPAFARVAHSSTLSVLSQPFVEAARALGASNARIVRRELLPNITGPMIAVTTVYVSAAILVEAGLSFLGLGIQPPEASWGNMLKEAQTYMQLAWWMAVFPGLGIALAVLGFNFLGDGLRDLLDPRSRMRR
jgi:peptide/nickel transport system permease protein